MQISSTQSILALYFSKQSIGVSHYSKINNKLQCGLIKFYVYSSQNQISNLISNKNIQILITNNNRHHFINSLQGTFKLITVDQRGLQDDIIENNISLLHFNPAKQLIRNKQQYIKLMRDQSESQGLLKQKYKSLGILLYYLLNQNNLTIVSTLYLNDIDFFYDKIFKSVQISNSELQTLDIIKEQMHPSMIKGKGRSKEGFSLLGLYQTPLSSMGAKKILRNIMKNPTYDKKLIQNRLNLLTWIKKCCNDYKNFIRVFQSVQNLDSILHKFSNNKVQNEDWKKLIKTLESMIIIHKMIQQRMKSSEQNQIPQMLNMIFDEVDWGQVARVLSTITSTLDINQGNIKKGVDLELDELKKTYDNLPHLLTLYARQQNWGDAYRIVFMTQIGYLIRVSHQTDIQKQIDKKQWNLQFIKNSGKFYINQLTQMLDQQYGDIYGEITDRQKKIHFQLENIVYEHYQVMQKAYWKICQLQCYVGIHVASNGMCRPKISSESLIISRGWHLLLSQQAIQNNAFSFNQNQAPKSRSKNYPKIVFNSQENLVNTHYSNRIMLITGPNASGKTVYLKQLAIIIFIAHLGFYVPAQFAEIPLIDKIILVQSKSSLYNGNNGFESEIVSLSRVLTPGMFSNKSLVLVDELGSSIDSVLAKKILASLIKFLSETDVLRTSTNEDLQQSSDEFLIPLTIAVTHLNDLISDSIVKQNYLTRCLTMDIEKNETYLYKIKPGLVKKGYGIQFAKTIMHPQFIEKAQKYWQTTKSNA